MVWPCRHSLLFSTANAESEVPHTTSFAQSRTSCCKSSDQCFLKCTIFSSGSSTAHNNSIDGRMLGIWRHTHGQNVCWWVRRLVILIHFIASLRKSRSERYIFWFVGPQWPRSMKCLERRYSEMKCWHQIRRECLLRFISMLNSASFRGRIKNTNKVYCTPLTIQGRDQHVPIRSRSASTRWASGTSRCHSPWEPLRKQRHPHAGIFESVIKRTSNFKTRAQTSLLVSARWSIKYVDDHRVFVSISSCSGVETPDSCWIVLNVSFRFAENVCYQIGLVYIPHQDSGKIGGLTLTAMVRIKPTSSRVIGIWASGSFGSKCGDLLYVLMRVWVARLMTWERQLLFIYLVSSCLKEVETYLIRRLHQGNTVFVRRSIWTENSSSIARLLLALSQVMWPIWIKHDRVVHIHEMIERVLTLCSIPTRSTILYSAWPSRFPS